MSASWNLLLDPLIAAGVSWQLPLLLAALLALRRLPPGRRVGLATPLALYLLAAAVLAASGIAAQSGAHDWTVPREVAVLLMGAVCIRAGALFLFRAALPAAGMRTPSIVEELLIFGAWALWALTRLWANGVALGNLVTTSAVITGIIAFSLQETLGNVFGGAVLQLEDAIHLDDWLRIDDVVGRVVDIGWHATRVETRNGETVVIPNAQLLRSKFALLGQRRGQPTQWRRWVWFGVGHGTPPQEVVRVVEEALARAHIPGVAAAPPPNCVAMDLNDGVAHYAVRYWLLDLAADDPTDSAVRSHVHAALRRAGLQLAVPETRQQLVQAGEAEHARLQERALAERTAALRRIELFASLAEAERTEVAKHMVDAPFVAGETVTRQGDVAHWLYVLARGEVEAVYQDERGHRQPLGLIRAGTADAIFGEYGMLTGAPRSSSVVALTDVDCYRLDKEGFRLVLERRPAIAEDLSAIMARRLADLAVAREALDQSARQRLMDASRHELLGRILRFFGLAGDAAVSDPARPASARTASAAP